MNRPIRVLVVDDSALVREVLAKGLGGDPEIEVVGTANDPYQARNRIVELKPDVLTLDVEMPRMDGVDFLRRLMPQHPMPVVMVSALTERGKKITLEALDAGAVDFVTKPSTDVARGLTAMISTLRDKVKMASRANVSRFKNRAAPTAPRAPVQHLTASTNHAIIVGASTGGTEAVRCFLEGLPVTTPGVVIVQHMPPGFTKLFAERMDELCAMDVMEASDGDTIIPGRVLIAAGAAQLKVVRSGGSYHVKVGGEEKVCGHCPSVEVLMQSAAKAFGPHAVGVMMTGMGKDGSQGMKAMRDAGARTLAQDEKSCVVFGMPKVAWDIGAAEKLVPLERISHEVLSLLSREVKV